MYIGILSSCLPDDIFLIILYFPPKIHLLTAKKSGFAS